MKKNKQLPNYILVENLPTLFKTTKSKTNYLAHIQDYPKNDCHEPFVNIDWFIEEVKKECVLAIYEHADKFNNGNLVYPLEDSIDLWFKGVAEKLAQRIKNG